MSLARCWLALGILAAVAVPSLWGSPAGGQDLATVEGVVTLDGKPLAGARIIIHLADRQFVGARSDDDGKYKIERVPAGNWKVTFEKELKGKNVVPARYSGEEQAVVRLEVKKGGNRADFNLTSK